MEDIKEQRRLKGLEAMKKYRATEKGQQTTKAHRKMYYEKNKDKPEPIILTKRQQHTKTYNDKNRERINENMRQRRLMVKIQ